MSSSASGHADPAFAEVKAVFEAGLANGDDLGAAVAVFVDGRAVVDLWGGIADRRTARPWTRDTACPTFSCTKGVTATAALMAAQQRRPWCRRTGERLVAGVRATRQTRVHTERPDWPTAPDYPSWSARFRWPQASDPAAMADLLAGQCPLWRPGPNMVTTL